MGGAATGQAGANSARHHGSGGDRGAGRRDRGSRANARREGVHSGLHGARAETQQGQPGIISDTQNAGKLTDSRVAAVYTGLAKQWSAATAPFVKLKPPAAYAEAFGAAAARVAPVEADLLATAKAGRTHNGTAGRAAGRRLALDFNSLGAAVAKLKKLLGLP